MFFRWDDVYNYFGIKDFIYFISSPSIQDVLFPIKIVFIFFTVFFFSAVIWFYINSSYIQFKFLQDVTEFLSRETYGLRKITKSWKKIKKRLESNSESEWKLAVIEADDFLYETLQDAGYQGETFAKLLKNTEQKIPNTEELKEAHTIRNSIVYESDYKLNLEQAKKTLSVYEGVIKSIAIV